MQIGVIDNGESDGNNANSSELGPGVHAAKLGVGKGERRGAPGVFRVSHPLRLRHIKCGYYSEKCQKAFKRDK